MYSSVEVNSQRIVHSRLAQCLFYERINSSWSKCSGPVWFSCLSSHGSLRWKFFRFYFESPEWRKCYARFAQVSEETASFFPELQKTQSTIVAVEFRPHIAVKFITSVPSGTFILAFFVVVLCVRIDHDRFGFLCRWFSQTSTPIHAADHPL